jgi:hypothetical protein
MTEFITKKDIWMVRNCKFNIDEFILLKNGEMADEGDVYLCRQ